MTKAELLKLLEPFDDNALVMVDGYEGGYDDLKTVSSFPVALNMTNKWYYGDHWKPDDYHTTYSENQNPEIVTIIHLEGKPERRDI